MSLDTASASCLSPTNYKTLANNLHTYLNEMIKAAVNYIIKLVFKIERKKNEQEKDGKERRLENKQMKSINYEETIIYDKCKMKYELKSINYNV